MSDLLETDFSWILVVSGKALERFGIAEVMILHHTSTTKGFLDCINRIRQKTLSHLSSFYGRVTLVMKEMGSMLDCRLHVT